MTKFNKIIQHLLRKRTKPEITWMDKYTIEFTIEDKLYKKYFMLHYQDTFTEEDENSSVWNYKHGRPLNKYYRLYYCQENVPQRGNLVTIEDEKWFQTEYEVIDEIKRLCKNWKY